MRFGQLEWYKDKNNFTFQGFEKISDKHPEHPLNAESLLNVQTGFYPEMSPMKKQNNLDLDCVSISYPNVNQIYNE